MSTIPFRLRFSQVKHRMRAAAWVGALLALGSAGAANRGVFLPRDEAEAAAMLADGSLDSATWIAARPFYAQPLSVPLGELRYLRDLFPQIDGRFPTTSTELARFEPWDAERVLRFFRDYPELVPYQPILDFSSGGPSHVGTAVVRLRQAPPSDTVAVTGRFDVAAAQRIRLQGAVGLDVRQARWQRRTFTVEVPVAGTLQVGNYSMELGEGLVGGYFPQSDETDTSIAANWLYGDTRSWNGVMLRTPLPRGMEFSAFGHARPTERALGAQGRAGYRGVEGTAGVTVMAVSGDTSVAADTVVTAHGGISFTKGPWHLAGCAAVDHRTPGAIPFVVDLRHNGDSRRLSLCLTRIPGGYRNERSRAQRSLSWSLTHGQGLLVDDLTAVDVEFVHRPASWINVTPRVSYITSGAASSLDASVSLWGSGWADYRLEWDWAPARNGRPAAYVGYLSAGRWAGRAVYVSSWGRIRASSEEYLGATAALTGEWRVAQGLRLTPYVSLSADRGEALTWNVGARQALDLFDRTRGEVSVDVPCGGERTEGVVFSVQTTFFL